LKRKRIHPEDMISDHATVTYVEIDVHERESQLAVFDPSGSLLAEERMPTAELERFIHPIPGEKHIAYDV